MPDADGLAAALGLELAGLEFAGSEFAGLEFAVESDAAPEGYRKQIEEYYRSLARDRKK